jgi:hypothetical protein
MRKLIFKSLADYFFRRVIAGRDRVVNDTERTPRRGRGAGADWPADKWRPF